MKEFNLAELTLICIAAISGALGGCTVAAHAILRGKRMRFALCLSYLIIGAGFGVMNLAYGHIIGLPAAATTVSLVGSSVIAGAAGALALASANISAKFILKQFGIEVEIQVKRTAK